MTDVFTSLKPAWHLDRIVDLRRGKNIVPTHLQLILSDLCNQNCHFCAYRMEGGFSTENFADEKGRRNPHRFIPKEKALEILSDFAFLGGKAVEFTGGGEPTVHPDHKEILAHAQSLSLQTGLVTNGVKLTDDEVFHNLTWLRISLDAGSAATYERIRESKQWDRVLKNIETAVKFTRPYVGVGFVITKENYEEILDACYIVKTLGVPYIRLSAMFSNMGAGYYKGIMDRINELRRLSKNLESEEFKVIDLFANRVEDLELAAPDYTHCGYQQFVLYIGGDQNVYTCCTNAYTTHGKIGDLSNQSLCEWIAKADRRGFDAMQCHHCQFNDKNKVINYLLEPNPPHVDFV